MEWFTETDILNDPRVRSALEDGLSENEIKILDCPQCGYFGYFNQGNYFVCRFCDKTFDVLSEGKSPEGSISVRADRAVSLADYGQTR